MEREDIRGLADYLEWRKPIPSAWMRVRSVHHLHAKSAANLGYSPSNRTATDQPQSPTVEFDQRPSPLAPSVAASPVAVGRIIRVGAHMVAHFQN